MHSPPVQPISASRSGIGAVATMSLEITTSRRCSSRRLAAQAFVASTRRSAVSTPCSVRTTGGERRSRSVTRECSCRRTPRSSATRRRPRTSSAGCTVAPPGSQTPARWVGEPVRRATSSGSRRHEDVARRRAARRPRRRRPRRRAAPASRRSTGGRRGRSARRRRWPRVQRPISSTASSAARARRDALLLAGERHQRAELRPPADREAAVAARGAVAADVLLQHDDVAVRLRAP